MQLRPYQFDLKQAILSAWRQHRVVAAIMPTGAGKSALMSSIIHDHVGASCVMAHRQELVSQIALATARFGTRHRIIGPSNVVKFCVSEQRRELGVSFYDPNATVAVAGVDTILARKDQLQGWLNQVTLWAVDECHHLTSSNKWGKAVEMMPHAKGLGVTATPVRADGKGLGSHADGVIDELLEGPTMRWLIDNGFLTDYVIYAPPSDLDLHDVPTSHATGDFNPNKLKQAVKRSHLVGDVVEHYKRYASGKLGVTFATDVETATTIAQQFNNAGVPAEVVSAKSPDHVRQSVIQRFRRRELLQLVNVDLFGEGFDLPAIEVVSMARPTQSYALYSQQFGRALRPMEGKERAIILDHAGNVVRHNGPPDRERQWTLDGRVSVPRVRNPDEDIPVRYCVNCTQPYERTKHACPYCGHIPTPGGRDAPEQVDGDLLELTPEAIARLRGEIAKVDEDVLSVTWKARRAGAPEIAIAGMKKQIKLKQEAQSALRESISWWAGLQRAQGRDDRESYKRFFHLFGTDVLSAQTLGRNDALRLAEQINEHIGRME